MNDPAKRLGVYDRATGALLPALAGMTPFVVFFPMTPPEQQGHFLILATLALTASLGLAWLFGARPLPGRPGAPLVLAIAFALATAVSIVLSGEPLYSLKKIMLPLAGFLFFGQAALHPDSTAVFRRTAWTLGWTGTLLAVYGIAQFFGFEILNYSEQVDKNRVIATIGHPNFLGSALAPLFFLFLGMGWTARPGMVRGATLAGVATMLVCLVLARSRAAGLGVVAGFGAMIALTLVQRARRRPGSARSGKFGVGAWIGAAAIVFLAAAAISQSKSFGEAQDRLLASNEVKSRIYYWNAAIDMGTARPLFGVGPGMFDPGFWPKALEQQRSPMGPFYRDIFPAIVARTPDHVHNEYLEIVAEQGFIGLALTLALILYFLYFGALAAHRCEDREKAFLTNAALAALVASLVDAFFGFPWRLPVSLLVVMTVIGMLHEGIERQSEVKAAGEPMDRDSIRNVH